MKMVLLICQNCGKEFERKASEAKRCAKHGFSIACGRSCGCAISNKKNPNRNPNSHLNLNCYNKQDEFSPFRYFISKANSKQRKDLYGESDLNLDFLKKLWESQEGVCPYTKKKMHLPKNFKERDLRQNPYCASLDRIDSSIGYVQSNVEFVCLAVNYAKNKFSKEEMIEFFSK